MPIISIFPTQEKIEKSTYIVNAPIGAIIVWSGTEDSVPQGWSICNGENGTLDLRDKFVLGAGEAHSVGDTGGSEEVTLTVEQMPEHHHTFVCYSTYGEVKAAKGSDWPIPIGSSETTFNNGAPLLMVMVNL